MNTFKPIITTLLIIICVIIFTNSCSKDNNKQEILLTIASEMGVGLGPVNQTIPCYIVKYESSSAWVLFYNKIQDFEYEEGYEYVIKVEKSEIENPQMDASSLQFSLSKIISVEKKSSIGIPDEFKKYFITP